MKKLVFASVMAMAIASLLSASMLRAQDSIAVQDPAELNTYNTADSQTDAKAKASGLESFLTAYPQTVLKKVALDKLADAYMQASDPVNALSATKRELQLDPANMKAVFISVYILKTQCGKTGDAQTCDDLAIQAQKGLNVAKPAATSDADWKKLTSGAYPAFHSALAVANLVGKKDVKAAISEYRTELMLYPPEQSTAGPALGDTLQLAEAYTKPDAKDLVQACWFYSRAWNFAPAAVKTQIEGRLEYYYKKYHGDLTGLDDLKAKAAASLFPDGTFVITPAATPADIAHKVVVETPDLKVLNLGDKEFILAAGVKDDAEKMWAVLKDQITPVPGIVIEASATVIKVAVTQDAKDAKVADFIVNMKKPLEEKEIPAVGFEYKIPPATSLVGTYDSYKQIPATATATQTAEIVLRDGEVQVEKKKPVAPVHKPAAGKK